MKAIVCTKHGGPETLKLEELPDPQPGENEVLIKTEAIGVNYVDTMRRSGNHPTAPQTPFVPGIELAGTVAGIGSGVTSFHPGDKVMARCVSHGAYAELVCAEERFTLARPDDVSAENAAALYVTGQTAYHALITMGNAAPGETVLITAAAGGVGSCAIQIAKILGLTVVAASGSSAKCELCRQLGANFAVNYSSPNWSDEVAKFTDDKGANLILESVGGDVAKGCIRCWADQGRMVVFGRASGKPAIITGDDLLFGHRQVAGMAVGRIIDDRETLQTSMEQLLKWVGQGSLRPVIGKTFRLEEAAAAHRELQQRETTGKILLVP